MIRPLLMIAAIAAGLYCLAALFLAWQQRRFLYVPDPDRPDVTVTGVPGAKAVTIRTSDGLELTAWWAPPASAASPVVLYLHGNGGSIGHRAQRFAQLHHFGWGVLMPDYRGYGGNPGAPTEAGLVLDAQAAWDSLKGRGVDASRIALWGESLGTGVAVQLATREAPGAVLLESPYTSIAAVARLRFAWAPVDWLILDRFELIGRLGQVRAPLLVMTGGRDTVVPPDMGRAVFAAANGPKQFWFAPKAGHNDLAEAGALGVVQKFVVEHLDHSASPISRRN